MIKLINLIKTRNVLIPVSMRFERTLILVGDSMSITYVIIQEKSYGTTLQGSNLELAIACTTLLDDTQSACFNRARLLSFNICNTYNIV